MTTTKHIQGTPNVDAELLDVLLAYKRELTDEQVAEMLTGMKPVVRQDDELFYIEPVDPKKVSFIWSPVIIEAASGLTKITSIYSLHTYGYYGAFKPSLEEVLSMIPQHMIGDIKAFEIAGPRYADDLNRQWAATNAGYHVAVTTLYGNSTSGQS